MLISAKGRYALRVLVDLAENQGGRFVPLQEIADRQEISEKYLETIVRILVKENILTGLRGKGGGYRLSRGPDQFTVGRILRLTEGTLSPVACLEEGNNGCSRSATCRTLPIWKGLDQLIDEYLEKFTIADLMYVDNPGDDYVI